MVVLWAVDDHDADCGSERLTFDTLSLRPLDTPPTPFILNSCSLERLRVCACFRGLRWWGRGESPMFIELKELELHPVDFKEQFAPGSIDFGEDLRQLQPLRTAGRAQLVEEHHGKHQTVQDIRIAGDLAVQVEVPCARCLEPVVENLKHDFDLLYRPQGTDAGKEELSITAADAEISYYQGEGLLLEDVLREQVLLALPLKALCRDDCKGLCMHCGKSMNEEECSCAEPMEDPRWQALKEIRSKLDN